MFDNSSLCVLDETPRSSRIDDGQRMFDERTCFLLEFPNTFPDGEWQEAEKSSLATIYDFCAACVPDWCWGQTCLTGCITSMSCPICPSEQ
jgi:hypothetical protein